MNIKLYRIQLFISVAKYLSITRAAREHRISQPAVSQQLKILQRDDLGIILYRNKGRGIELTEAGRSFYKDALAALSHIEQLENKYSRRNAKCLTLAASYRPSRYLLPALMTAFSIKHPEAKLTLHTRTSLEIEKLLLDWKVDLAITTNPTGSMSSFITEPYCRESVAAFVAANHPLAKMKSVRVSEIETIPLIIKFRRDGQSRVETQLGNFGKEGIKFRTVVSCETSEVVKEFVRHGGGVGFLYYNSIKRGIERGEFKVIRFPGLELSGQAYIVYSKDKPLSALAREFLSLLRASLTSNEALGTVAPQRLNNRRNGHAADYTPRSSLSF